MIVIDWTNFVKTQLPRSKRTPIVEQWITFLLKPAIEVYDKLLLYFNDVRYRTAFNGQVIYLEHLINATFNNGGDEIFIEDGPINETYLFNESEINEDVYLFNETEAPTPEQYVFNEDDSTGDELGFIINVPNALPMNVPQFTALVNSYKLAGMSYTINYY